MKRSRRELALLRARFLEWLLRQQIEALEAGDDRASAAIVGALWRGALLSARDEQNAYRQATALQFRAARKALKDGASVSDALLVLREGAFGWLDDVSDALLVDALERPRMIEGFEAVLRAKKCTLSRDRVDLLLHLRARSRT
jgi:hypothetical protein